MAITLNPSDILAFNNDLDEHVVEILIKDGLAMARRVAPCLDDPDFAYADAAVAIIRGAVLRWAESGSGAVSSQQFTAGPFGQSTSFDTRQTRRSLFFPSEIKELESLCSDHGTGPGAIDTLPVPKRRCAGCDYLVGSVSSPCQVCGETMHAGLV